MELEESKVNKNQEEDDSEMPVCCQDILPRHLIRDMLEFGQSQIKMFKQSFENEDFLYQAYGLANQSDERSVLEEELEVIVCIVEVWNQVGAFASDWFKRALVELGALEFTLDILYTLKVMVDSLDHMGIFEQWKLKRQEPEATQSYFEEEQKTAEQSPDKKSYERPVVALDKHPFSGFLSKLVSLVCSLTYRPDKRVEDFFMSEPDGKLRLGAILTHTKMDVDNPMLREWCLVVIRNLCAWSERIREDLAKLQLIEVSEEGKKSLDQLGVREMFEREISKLKKKDVDGNEVYENHNIHFDTVDF